MRANQTAVGLRRRFESKPKSQQWELNILHTDILINTQQAGFTREANGYRSKQIDSQYSGIIILDCGLYETAVRLSNSEVFIITYSFNYLLRDMMLNIV